jgi:SH3 domain
MKCLQDIDFDFMYALHSFAATVEGQANATKGDMLVLLDDSNSYWWLVRIVKDHTVGNDPNFRLLTRSRLPAGRDDRDPSRTSSKIE